MYVIQLRDGETVTVLETARTVREAKAFARMVRGALGRAAIVQIDKA